MYPEHKYSSEIVGKPIRMIADWKWEKFKLKRSFEDMDLVEKYDYRAKRAKWFVRAVNEILKGARISEKYHMGIYKHHIHKKDNEYGEILVGYQEGGIYFIDSDLLYEETKHWFFGFLPDSKWMTFRELFRDGLIEPHLRLRKFKGRELKAYIGISCNLLNEKNYEKFNAWNN